jgi:hypothetical protein
MIVQHVLSSEYHQYSAVVHRYVKGFNPSYLLILLLSIGTLLFVYKTTMGRDNYFYLWLDRATLSDHNTHHKKNSVIKNCCTALRYSLTEYA